MKLLIQGPRHIGKTVAITNFLKKYGDNFSYGGYRTFSKDATVSYQTDVNKNIYIIEASKFLTPYFNDEQVIATRPHVKLIKENLEEFCSNKLICDVKDKKLIVLDEIGFLEMGSEKFTDTIISIFNENKNILGVMKQIDNDYVNKIKSISGVKVIDYDRLTINNIMDDFYNNME